MKVRKLDENENHNCDGIEWNTFDFIVANWLLGSILSLFSDIVLQKKHKKKVHGGVIRHQTLHVCVQYLI